MKKASMIAIFASMPAMSVPALAQPAATTSDPPESSSPRTVNLTVYGNDSCPPGRDNEIVVCARRPEAERYRIPKELREKSASSGAPGWTSQAATMEETQRDSLPVSGCSVVSSSAAGCLAKALRQWRAERRMEHAKNHP